MLEVEHALNHPILRVFCHVISRLPRGLAIDDPEHSGYPDAKEAKNLPNLYYLREEQGKGSISFYSQWYTVESITGWININNSFSHLPYLF